MTNEKIISLCLEKNGAFIDYPFGPDVTVIKVKSESSKARIFAQIFSLKGERKATFNCDQMTGEFYRSMYPKIVTRGYHCPAVQQPYFNTVSLDENIPDEEIINMINHSYKTVVGKFPKKVQKELL